MPERQPMVIVLAESGVDEESDAALEAVMAAVRATRSRSAPLTVIGDVEAVVLAATVAAEFDALGDAIRLAVLPAHGDDVPDGEAREALGDSIDARWLEGHFWRQAAADLIPADAGLILAIGSGDRVASLLESAAIQAAGADRYVVSLQEDRRSPRPGWGPLPNFNQGDGYYVDFTPTLDGRPLSPMGHDANPQLWEQARQTRWRIALTLAIERVIAGAIGEVFNEDLEDRGRG